MTNRLVASKASTIDPAWLAKIVREVLARLDAMKPTNSHTAIDRKVIDAKTIEQLTKGSIVSINAMAIVTPAAKDEAKLRNITLIRGTRSPIKNHQQSIEITSSNGKNSDQIDAVRSQLARRGIPIMPECVVLSDTPAREVADQFGRSRRAVMIGSLDDVKRFGSELDVEVWVLDTQKMNLMTTVNAIVAITRLENNGQ